MLAHNENSLTSFAFQCRFIHGLIIDIIASYSRVDEQAPHGVYEILAQWDSEAGVWVAESEDVPGLVAEADSPNALARKLRVLTPELLELNGVPSGKSARFRIRYQHEESGVLTS